MDAEGLDAYPDDFDDFIAEFAEDLTEFEEVVEHFRLAIWRAWDHAAPRTSQRRALQSLQFFKTVLVFGGNRSGKTDMMLCILVVLAIGSDHPVAQVFWRANGCDPDAFPKGPGRCYLVALTTNDSLRYHRKKLDTLIPGVRHWWNKNGRGEARVEIEVPGYAEVAEIWCKSEDQGEEGMQGDACRAILHDEEGKTRNVWTEADARLLDFDGWHLMSNTPLKGRTWVWDDFVKETPEDASVHYIHTADNPFMGQVRADRLARKDPDRAEARTKGSFVVVKGLIYGDWNTELHVVDPFDLKPEWPRFRVMDFGFRHPSAVLWACSCTDLDGLLAVYGEHYKNGWSLKQHADLIKYVEGKLTEAPDWKHKIRSNADAIRGHHGGVPVQKGWADSHSPQLLADMRRDHEVYFSKAKKDFDVGRNAVVERLRLQADGKPRIVFFRGRTPNLIREIEGYQWGPKGERPIALEDHCMDDLRYLCMGTRRL